MNRVKKIIIIDITIPPQLIDYIRNGKHVFSNVVFKYANEAVSN